MPSTYTPLVTLDRFSAQLHAQLLNSIVAPSTFQGDNAVSLGGQLANSPAGWNAVVTLENEQILCTYTVSGTTVIYTIIERGYNNTTPATHNVTPTIPTIEVHLTKATSDNINTAVLDHDQKVYGTVAANGYQNGLIPYANILTIATATSHTYTGDVSADFVVGRTYIFKVGSTWYRATVTVVAFSVGVTTVTISGDSSLPASGTIVATAFGMDSMVAVRRDYEMRKYASADPSSPPPTGSFFLYFKSGGLYTMDSTGTVVQLSTALTEPVGTLTAGENISGGQAIYVKASDGKAYRSISTGDESTYSFVGVAVATVTTGATVQYWKIGAVATGVASGTIGQTAFITDTAGTIGVAPGTRYASIGVYVSATSIEIRTPKFIRRGSQNITAATTYVQTCGFYPRRIAVRAGMSNSGRITGISVGDDGNRCVFTQPGNSAANNTSFNTSHAWLVVDDLSLSAVCSGTITSIGQTGFTLSADTGSAGNGNVDWEAEN